MVNCIIIYLVIIQLIQISDVELKILVLNKFCASQQKDCQPKKHIACLPFNEKYPNIRLMMELQLNSSSKTKIVMHFNQLKNNYALGYSAHGVRPWGNRTISNMRGLSWNDELAIIALKSFLNGYGNNNQSFCYTYATKPTWKMYSLFEISSSMVFHNKINDETFPILLNGLTEQFNINILNDVTSNLFGCAGGVYVENNRQIKIKLKCMFSRINPKRPLMKIGTPCDNCGDWNEFCNQHFSGLCGETKIPVKTFDVKYMSDVIALPLSENQTFFQRTELYLKDVSDNKTYYLLAYSLFLAIISSVLACIWKCRENPVFCLCKTVICCASKKLSKTED